MAIISDSDRLSGPAVEDHVYSGCELPMANDMGRRLQIVYRTTHLQTCGTW